MAGMNLKSPLAGMIKQEKDIYYGIYFVVFFSIALVAFSAASGLFTAHKLINIVNNYDNSSVIRSIGSKSEELRDMQSRLRLIKSQFENMKYPDRTVMRDTINKDLAKLGLTVQALTLKDLPLETINTRVAKPGDLTPVFDKNNMPAMIEVSVAGVMPLSSLLDFFKLTDRTDRLWFVDRLTISPPEGLAEFFGKSFVTLPLDRKKEMFKLYEESLSEDPSVSVVFTFFTFVSSAGQA